MEVLIKPLDSLRICGWVPVAMLLMQPQKLDQLTGNGQNIVGGSINWEFLSLGKIKSCVQGLSPPACGVPYSKYIIHSFWKGYQTNPAPRKLEEAAFGDRAHPSYSVQAMSSIYLVE